MKSRLLTWLSRTRSIVKPRNASMPSSRGHEVANGLPHCLSMFMAIAIASLSRNSRWSRPDDPRGRTFISIAPNRSPTLRRFQVSRFLSASTRTTCHLKMTARDTCARTRQHRFLPNGRALLGDRHEGQLRSAADAHGEQPLSPPREAARQRVCDRQIPARIPRLHRRGRPCDDRRARDHGALPETRPQPLALAAGFAKSEVPRAVAKKNGSGCSSGRRAVYSTTNAPGNTCPAR